MVEINTCRSVVMCVFFFLPATTLCNFLSFHFFSSCPIVYIEHEERESVLHTNIYETPNRCAARVFAQSAKKKWEKKVHTEEKHSHSSSSLVDETKKKNK